MFFAPMRSSRTPQVRLRSGMSGIVGVRATSGRPWCRESHFVPICVVTLCMISACGSAALCSTVSVHAPL
eukprot:6698422-Pyramimonas_sp.AAC.1